MAKVAFIGLGVMGYPMARHLAQKGGHELTVYNRTGAKAEKWVAEYGGRSAADAEGRRGRRRLRLHLRRQRQRPARGDAGARGRLRRHAARAPSTSTTPRRRPSSRASSTTPPRRKGFGSLDAPVSGGQAGAENGQLTVMVRRRCRRLRAGEAGDRVVRQDGRADGAGRRRASSPRW